MIVIGWIAFSILGGVIGSDRQCGFAKAFLISLFFSPLIGIIYAFASTKNSTIDFQNRMLGRQPRTFQSEIEPILPSNDKPDSLSGKWDLWVIAVFIIIVGLLLDRFL